MRIGPSETVSPYTFKETSRRSRMVWECTVCGALTNRVPGDIKHYRRSGEYVGTDYDESQVECPHINKPWHENICEKLYWLVEKPHPKSYAEELIREILSGRGKRTDNVRGQLGKTRKLIPLSFPDDDDRFQKRMYRKFLPQLRRDNESKES